MLGDAAKALQEVGFDGIFLHFGHGLQVGQFLSPLTNKRTDQFGGSLENRARYPRMIIDAIRERVGRDMLIEMRISGSEMEEGGIRIEEAIEFTKMVQHKIDLVQVSCGMHNTQWMTVAHPCGFLPPVPNVYLAEAFKKSGNIHIPVVTIGGIQNPNEAEKILADGKADIVAIARGIIADTDLVNKVYDGRSEDVTPCIKCMRCHDSTVFEHKYLCAVNPVIGMGHVLPNMITPPKTKKKIAVIGGGPAGMKAALTASERGHHVILYEEDDSLGGMLKFSDFVSFKYPVKSFKDYLVKHMGKSDVIVRLNTHAKPENLIKEKYDVIIAAIGAEPIVPEISGCKGRNVVSAIDAYGNEKALGEKIVVIGGGQVGCETALHLAKEEKNVTIIEMLPKLAPDASPTHRMELMLELDREQKLEYITNARCTRINDKTATYSQGVDDRITGGDTIILAIGMQARSAEAERFVGVAERFLEIGDCVRAGKIENAIKDAYSATVTI